MYIFTFKGSECISKTRATGVREDEATSINSTVTFLVLSLEHLLMVNVLITIPYYWNNELTHLLQDSIGGNSKTIMVKERLILRYISMLGEWE